MAKVESKKVYVKIEPSEAIEAKRNLLESMVHLINMLVASKKFKRLRKDELTAVRQGKTEAPEIIEDIEKLQEKLPQMEKPIEKHMPKTKIRGRRKVTIVTEKHIGKTEKYRMELEDIKAKLAELGS